MDASPLLSVKLTNVINAIESTHVAAFDVTVIAVGAVVVAGVVDAVGLEKMTENKTL